MQKLICFYSKSLLFHLISNMNRTRKMRMVIKMNWIVDDFTVKWQVLLGMPRSFWSSLFLWRNVDSVTIYNAFQLASAPAENVSTVVCTSPSYVHYTWAQAVTLFFKVALSFRYAWCWHRCRYINMYGGNMLNSVKSPAYCKFAFIGMCQNKDCILLAWRFALRKSFINAWWHDIIFGLNTTTAIMDDVLSLLWYFRFTMQTYTWLLSNFKAVCQFTMSGAVSFI